jgi:REP element-mobilizing transposase RayT
VKHHNRQSTRLPDRDYTAPGLYFVTICTENRVRLFGEVLDGTMQLSEAGNVVKEAWLRTAILRPYVTLDEFVVMPDHFHAILAILYRVGTLPIGTDTDARRMATLESPMTVLDRGYGSAMSQHEETGPQFGKPIAGSLGTIVGGFKSAVTYRINKALGTRRTSPWQRNYDDRIIRNRIELEFCRRYIENNPQRWSRDHDD